MWVDIRGGGKGVMIPAARIFKESPCLGVKFSNIHPASESDFLSGSFLGGGGNLLLCKFFVMLFFLLFSNQFFWRER